jgi:hypothetical protein
VVGVFVVEEFRRGTGRCRHAKVLTGLIKPVELRSSL